MVGGLAMGMGLAAALSAAATIRLGGGQFLILSVFILVAGASVGGGVLYLDYVKAHVHLDLTQASPSVKVISLCVTLVVLYVAATLLSALMIPIVLVGLSYVRAKRQRGQTWRERTEMFIAEAMPRIAVL